MNIPDFTADLPDSFDFYGVEYDPSYLDAYCMRTPKEALEKITNYGHNLEVLPEKLRIPQFCWAAIKKNGTSL